MQGLPLILDISFCFELVYARDRRFANRQNTLILGNLDQFGHFRHFLLVMDCPNSIPCVAATDRD